MASQHNTKKTLTAQMFDWVLEQNDNDIYPRYTDINNYYKKISGSNSFSHHLANMRYMNTDRKCKRYLKKLTLNPSIKHNDLAGRYMVEYRKVHPRLDGLKKLRSRLNNWLYSTRKNGLHEHETFYTVQQHLNTVQARIHDCTNYYTYTMNIADLKLFNNLYNTYNIKANKR